MLADTRIDYRWLARIKGHTYNMFRRMADVRGGHYLYEDGYETVITKPNNYWPNWVLNPAFPDDRRLPARIDDLHSRMIAGQLPETLVTVEQSDPDHIISYLCHRTDFRNFVWTPMFRSLQDVPEVDNPLDIQQVGTYRGLQDFTDVMESGMYGSGKRLDEDFFVDLAAQSDFMFTVGYEGDTPVATAMSHLADGLAGLFAIAVHPDYRGKGYGKAATLDIMHRSRAAGFDACMLIATDAGVPLYDKLGYRACGAFRGFTAQ